MMEVRDKDTANELFPAELGYLPQKFVEKAEIELSETPERRKNGIKELRDMIRQDPSIRNEWFSDDDIVMYLRCKKYDVHKAFTSLRRMVSIIKKNAKIFDRVNLKDIINNLDTDVCRFLPYRNKDGTVIVLTKLGDWEPSELDHELAVVYFAITLWHVLSDPMSQVNGVTLIYDSKASFLKYFRYTNPVKVYHLYQFVVECVPMRMKIVHVTNPNTLTRVFLSPFLAFAPEKIRSRIKIHHDSADLLDYLPACLVPNEFGGRLTKEGRLCSWSKKVKIPDYILNIVNSAKHLN